MGWNRKIENILTAFKSYIDDNYGKAYLKKFNDRERDNPEAAASEALVFNWLYGHAQNPALNDDLSTGGLDFIVLRIAVWEALKILPPDFLKSLGFMVYILVINGIS